MREIKFRQWDSVNNAMRYPYLTAIWGDFECYPLMQYTGLKDKNGKEIYEGDAVRILYTDWPSNTTDMGLNEYKESISNFGHVVYSDSCAGFEVKIGEDCCSILPGRHGEIEVIGNIYEHGHLLDG